MACRASRASATVLPSGPCTAQACTVGGKSSGTRPSGVSAYAGGAQPEMRPTVGRTPTTPQQAAGKRIDPPMSLPCASGVIPAAIPAAAPPLEPPGVRAASHGFRVRPCRSFVENQRSENAGTLLRPSGTPLRRGAAR